MKLNLIVDRKTHIIEENDNVYTSPSFHSYIKIIKNREHKYTVNYDIIGVCDKSFTTLIGAFREGLLTQENYR